MIFTKNYQKTTFSTSKMGKTRMSIWPKSADFWVQCRPTSSIFSLLVLFKKLNSFAHIAKHIKKKRKKKTRFFYKKLTENDFFDTQNRQNSNVNLAKKFQFLGPLSTYELYFWLVGPEKKIKIVPPNSLNDLKKKEKKYTRFSPKNIWKGKYAPHPHPHRTTPDPHNKHRTGRLFDIF